MSIQNAYLVCSVVVVVVVVVVIFQKFPKRNLVNNLPCVILSDRTVTNARSKFIF